MSYWARQDNVAFVLYAPWPPSVNQHLRAGRGKFKNTPKWQNYIDTIGLLVKAAHPERYTGKLKVNITAMPPDNRRRDLDNVLKSIIDACQVGGAFADDSQIDVIYIRRAKPIDKGAVSVIIQRLEPPE